MMLWQKCLKSFQYLKGAHEKEGEWPFIHADSDRTVRNSFKLKEVRFRSDDREKILLWGWWSTGKRCSENLWMSHSWRCSKPGWMGPWANRSNEQYPCHQWRGWNEMIFKIPSNPSLSTVLWKSGSVSIISSKFGASWKGLIGNLQAARTLTKYKFTISILCACTIIVCYFTNDTFENPRCRYSDTLNC